MSNLKNIIDMLGFIENSNNENVLIAKGKYKVPRSVRGIYKVQKRHLKYRNNGGK